MLGIGSRKKSSRAIALDDEQGFVQVAPDVLAVDEAQVAATRGQIVSHLDRVCESGVAVRATRTHAAWQDLFGPGGL